MLLQLLPILAVDRRRQRLEVAHHRVDDALAPGPQARQIARQRVRRAGRPGRQHQLGEHRHRVVLGLERRVRPAVGHAFQDRLVAPAVEGVALHAELQALEGGGGVERPHDDLVDGRPAGITEAADQAAPGPQASDVLLVGAAARGLAVQPPREDQLLRVGRQRLGDRAGLEGEVGAVADGPELVLDGPVAAEHQQQPAGEGAGGLGAPVQEGHERRERGAGPDRTQEVSTS